MSRDEIALAYLAMQTVGYGMLAAVIVVSISPTVIGVIRGVKHPWLLFIGNMLFAWTVLGWFIALVYAAASEARPRRVTPASPGMAKIPYYDTHNFFPDRKRAQK